MTTQLHANALTVETREGKRLLDQVSLTLHAGKVTGVIGPNGAGKSTLVKVLAGLRQPQAGQVLLNDVDLQQQSPQQRARRLGYLEQRPVLHWPFTASQVVALARLVHGDADTPAGRLIIDNAMQVVGISRLAQRPFLLLSEGEKLLVNVARVLAAAPQIILADEPTAALDPARQLQVMALLRTQARAGLAVLVVLHELTLAARYCDNLMLLHEGVVMAAGTPADVLTRENLRRVYQLDAQWDAARATLLVDIPTDSQTP